VAENREIILDAIATALVGIVTADGYRTTVTTVSREFATFEDTTTASRPWISYFPDPGAQPARVYEFGGSRYQLDVFLVAILDARTQAEKTAAVADLAADIEQVMVGENATWGGYAVQTTCIQDAQSDEGAEDPKGTKGGSVTFTMKFRIEWYE